MSAYVMELTGTEIELISGGSDTAGTLKEMGNIVMATGAAGAAVGVVFGQPEIVAASAVIGGIGGVLYLAGSLME